MIKLSQHTSKPIRGFTLIELMIVVAIISVVMLIMFSLWLSMIRSTRMIDAKVKMEDDARIALNHMVRNLRMANIRTAGQVLTTSPDGVTFDWFDNRPME